MRNSEKESESGNPMYRFFLQNQKHTIHPSQGYTLDDMDQLMAKPSPSPESRTPSEGPASTWFQTHTSMPVSPPSLSGAP